MKLMQGHCLRDNKVDWITLRSSPLARFEPQARNGNKEGKAHGQTNGIGTDSQTVSFSPSLIDVTERPVHRAQRIADPDAPEPIVDAEIDNVVERRIATGRVVQEGDGPGEGVVAIDAGRDVLILPDPPRAVDLRVMEPEERIAVRGTRS